MKNLTAVTDPMSLTEIATRASYQVIIGNEKTLSPESAGSGCILYYKEKLLFLTVAHVTDKANTTVTIETHRTPVKNQSVNYCVGTMNYTDEYRIEDLEKFKKDKDLSQAILTKIQTLDFAFAILPEIVAVLQPHVDFRHHGIVTGGHKIVITGDTLSSLPDPNEPILFCGNINSKFENGVLSRQSKLTVDCMFVNEICNFYKLELPSVINHESEFQGTSGAPIFDTTGKFFGLISCGSVGTPYIYAFSNKAIMRFLDYHLLTEKHN